MSQYTLTLQNTNTADTITIYYAWYIIGGFAIHTL